MEMAIVGNHEFVLGFRLVGIRKIYSCPDDKLEMKISMVLDDKDVGILVLHDSSLSKLSQPMRSKLRESIKPVLITVGEEEEDLREKVRRTIGIDLYVAK